MFSENTLINFELATQAGIDKSRLAKAECSAILRNHFFCCLKVENLGIELNS